MIYGIGEREEKISKELGQNIDGKNLNTNSVSFLPADED